jgi:predicted esterase
MLEEAPDVARARLEAFQTPDDSLSPEQRLALIESAWVAGSEHATSDESTAESYWVARELVRSYLRTGADQQLARDEILGRLKKLGQSGGLKNEKPAIDLAVLTEISRQMPPPLHDQRASAPGTIRTIRVFDDPNPGEPSEYAAWLPPEYHSSRSYPAIVVLHGKESPSEALGPWLEEATRRGFILIAPEYGMRGKPAAYQYSSGEHAAVLLALHDARRRFAIDSNRVFLAGTLEGGNMAWDVALAHPDLFAGAAVISGFPAKFAWPNKANAGFVPLYLVMGDLSAPTEDPVVFEQWAKPLIKGNNDIRYVKMYKRGLEPFPEEIPTILQWASSRSRVPAPNKWEAVSCREGDDRFYGIVIKGFAPNRATSPISADPLGRNINPAEMKLRSNNVLNKLVVDTNGITALDIWVSPSLIDFTKRVEVQHNGKSVFKAQPDLAEFRPFLDDLRIRGDRQQTYWLKVPLNASPGRGGRGG